MSDQESITGLRYIYTAIFFWLSPLFMEKKAQSLFFSGSRIPSPAALKKATASLCLSGLFNRPTAGSQPVAYQSIEHQAVLSPAELPPEDRIYTAIEEVVSQCGLEEASIDKIAARIGMTKSSLYFYFKNKDDMLGQMMKRKQDYMLQLLQQKLQPYSRFTDQSYAFMVSTASYLLERPVFFTLFNWLRFQNIKLNLQPPNQEYIKKFFSFIIDAVGTDLLKIQPEEALRASVFLHVLTFSEVLDFREKPEAKENLFEELRLLHHYYLYGFPGIELSPDKTAQSGGQ